MSFLDDNEPLHAVPHDEPVDEVGPAGTPPPAPAAPPVIVVQYREKTWVQHLMPAALVLLAALAISSFQRRTPVRLTPNRATVRPEAPKKPAAPEVPLVVKVITKGGEPAPDQPAEAPLLARNDPHPVASEPAANPFDLNPAHGLEPLPAAAPEAAPEPEKVKELPPEPPAAPKPEPKVETPAPPPQPAPAAAPVPEQAPAEVSAEDIERDIRREAQAKEAELKRNDGLKTKAKSLLLAESYQKIQANRLPFRQQLRAALNQPGDDLSEAIDGLCNQFGREVPDELRERYVKFQRTRPLRLTRTNEVMMMRALGLPEPMILDYLAHQLHKSINTRGGPRDENEVRIAAARQLLAIPLNPSDPARPRPKTLSTATPARPRP